MEVKKRESLKRYTVNREEEKANAELRKYSRAGAEHRTSNAEWQRTEVGATRLRSDYGRPSKNAEKLICRLIRVFSDTVGGYAGDQDRSRAQSIPL
jgi:hypothetical protein